MNFYPYPFHLGKWEKNYALLTKVDIFQIQYVFFLILQVNKGEFVFLTGASGSGKSSAVSLALGMDNFQRGQILINGVIFI
jgi:ABC-type lipoprotein export system ATPase subunit